MVLGLENIRGLEFLSDIDITKFLTGVGQIILSIVLFVIVGAGIYFIFSWLSKKKTYNKNIYWFEEGPERMIPIGQDQATELIIPGTNIPVFYIKSKDMYLARPVRKMGKNDFWFAIRNNSEIINFSMKNLNTEMKEAGLDYDHTDMRYASSYLKELIKRNYRDNSQPWWREYKELISVVVLLFVFTLCMIFIMVQMGKIADKLGLLIDHADQLVQAAKSLSKTSGVVGS